MIVSIYVACHKKTKKIFHDKCLKYIEVGRFYHKRPLFKLNDMDGFSISHKNLSYNELTAQYWAWKNDKKSDIVGLCHYRRFFMKDTKLLKSEDVKKILDSYDAIAYKIRLGTGLKLRINTRASSLRFEDIEKVGNIINRLYGQRYIKAFNYVIERDWNYMCNMFICRKDLFDSYSEWLFNILKELEKEINESELIGNEKRIYGLWGEYLFNVFMIANDRNIFDAKVKFVEEKKKTKINYFIKKVRVKLGLIFSKKRG